MFTFSSIVFRCSYVVQRHILIQLLGLYLLIFFLFIQHHCHFAFCQSFNKVFSKRQRITLRLLYAIAIPSVVCRLSVCLSSVCLWRWCTVLRRLNFSAIFFHHTIAQGLYFSGAKNRWWGTPLSPWNLRSKWHTPFQTAKFRPISAHRD